MSDEKNIFTFHGVIDLNHESGQLVGDCPFCQKEGHFYVAPDTLQWECKRCTESGNKYSFLKKIHKQALDATTPADYEELAERRGLTVKTLIRFRTAKNPLNDNWLLPTYNLKKQMTNLHGYNPHSNSLYSSPDVTLGLFNLQNLSKETDRPLYICEGHWDTLVMDEMTRKGGRRDEIDIIGVPGAGTFKDSFCKFLSARHVTLCYDNDDAGRKGAARVAKVIGKNVIKPTTLSVLEWSKVKEGLAEGYDLGDLKIDCKDAKSFYASIGSASLSIGEFATLHGLKDESGKEIRTDSAATSEKMKPIKCETYQELTDHFKNSLYMTQSMKDTLAVMLAVNVSTHIRGNPLWVHVIGPPSSGKTTLGMCVGVATEYAKSVSKFTGLVSGWKDQDNTDASLLAQTNHKMLFIKDFTATLCMPAGTRDNLFGELRDAFDGKVDTHYRNRQGNSYGDVNFTVLTCVTDEIRAFNTSALGERFLYCELLGEDHSEEEHMSVSFDNELESLNLSFSEESDGKRSPGYYKLQQRTYGFLKHKHAIMELDPKARAKFMPKITPEYKHKLNSLASLVAKVRATVNREKHSDLAYRPRAELGSRLGSQFLRLAAMLAFVMDRKSIDEEVFRIVRKIALDTAYGFQWEIAQALSKHSTGLTTEQIATKINLSKSTVVRRVKDMQVLNLIMRREESNNSDNRGRYKHYWLLTPHISQLFKDIALKPKSTPNKNQTTKKRRRRRTRKVK